MAAMNQQVVYVVALCFCKKYSDIFMCFYKEKTSLFFDTRTAGSFWVVCFMLFFFFFFFFFFSWFPKHTGNVFTLSILIPYHA